MIARTIYTEKIIPFIGKKLIKILIGQRRVGKSMILKLLIELIKTEHPDANIIYIDKEDYSFDNLKDYHDLMDYILEHQNPVKNFIFIDEIHEIDQFEKALRSLYDKENFDIYCSGSNATMFSGNLSSVLSGRQIFFHIGSLSFNEFCIFHNLSASQEALVKYLKYGGLPFLMHLQDDENIRNEYLKNIYSTILFRDIINRNNIRDPRFLTDLVKFLADNTGQQFSANSISKYLKSQRITKNVGLIYDYLSYIEDAYFVNVVKRMDIHGKKIFEIGEKYYFEDLGIRNAIIGFNINDISKLIENVVFLHLKINNYEIKTGYLKDAEIDFVANKNNEICYFQVTYLLSDQKTIDREFGNLLSINDNYPKYVISFDGFSAPSTYKGIKHLTLLEFLTDFK